MVPNRTTDHIYYSKRVGFKKAVSGTTFPWWLTPFKKLRSQLILFQDIDHKRIQQSDGISGLTEHTRPQKLVLSATFPWWLSTCKKSKVSLDS